MIDVFIVVLPGTMLLDLGLAETFRMATQFGAKYRVHFVGPRSRAASSVGLDLCGISPLPEHLPPTSTVLVPGTSDSATAYLTAGASETAAWLARVIRPKHRLCTVCSGIFLVAQTGLLRGKTCTCHHLLTERLARECSHVRVEENRTFVQDGQLYTSAGATTGFDLALHLIAEDNGPLVALEVARMLVIYFRRSGADPQLSPWLLHRNHIHPAVHRAQDAVIRDPARQWTLTALASEGLYEPSAPGTPVPGARWHFADDVLCELQRGGLTVTSCG